MYKHKLLCAFMVITLLMSNSLAYAEFEDEDGRYHIVTDENDEGINGLNSRVYSSYKKDGLFYIYNNVTINVYENASTSSKVVGSVSPQMLIASKRSGNYFYVDTVWGYKWIKKDDNVELREIDDMNNDKFTTQEVVKLHSQPFSNYATDINLPIGTYEIKKKAGDWYYISSDLYEGWFCTTKGSFEGGITTLNVSSILNIPLKIKLAKISDNVRPGNPMKPKYIIIHNTANTSKGANAERHANLLYNQSINGSTYASWHFSVDDNEIYQSLPLNEIGYHAGDGSGPGNRSGIGIEICENIDGDYLKAEDNAAALTAYLLRINNLPISSVKKHQDFSGKYCPARILDRDNGWGSFINKVKTYYDKLSSQFEPVDNEKYYLDINTFYGDTSVNNAINMINRDLGWYVEPEKISIDLTKYRITTGEFNSESIVKDCLNRLIELTGWWATYEPTSNGKYRIVTGEFRGEESAKQALNLLQKNTDWWAIIERTSDIERDYQMTEFYRIETGEFNSESIVKDYLNRLIELTGWWATYEPTSNGKYRIVTGEFRGEESAKQALNLLQKNTDWWATYKPTGRVEYHYRIKTGYFNGKTSAEKSADIIRSRYGWHTELKLYK